MHSWPILVNILTNKHQSYKYSFVLKVYFRLFSGLTYIMFDMIFGLLSITLILYNVNNILEFCHRYFSSIHIESLSQEVEWLKGLPAGVKTYKDLNLILGYLIS